MWIRIRDPDPESATPALLGTNTFPDRLDPDRHALDVDTHQGADPAR
jgi:hypothetical protein